MTHSKKIDKLAAALRAVQATVGFVPRDSRNEDTDSRYSSIVAVVAALKESFGNAGLVYAQDASVIQFGGVFVTDVSTLLIHSDSEQWLKGQMQFPCPMHSTQQAAAAVSMAKRYGLASLAGVVSEHEDRDGQGTEPEPVIEQRHTMLLKAERPKGIGPYFKQVFEADGQRFYAKDVGLAAALAQSINQTVTLTLKGYADGGVEIVGISQAPVEVVTAALDAMSMPVPR